MSDQAEMLRRIVDNMNNGLPKAEGLKPEKRARVITITSKGGVRKAGITVNLAIALSRLGLR